MYVRAVVGIMMRMTKRVRKDGLVVMRGDVGDGTIYRCAGLLNVPDPQLELICPACKDD